MVVTLRGISGECSGFLFEFPVDSAGIANGILDLRFSEPIAVDLSATRFTLFGLAHGFAGTFPPIVSATVVLLCEIDTKPGSFPNPINPRSRGVTAVAILTTGTCDATTVDASTVLFGATGAEASPVHSALEDVNGDGHLDMILHFRTQQTGIECGDTSASLTGETLDGKAIQDSDLIKTVGCKTR